MATADPDLPPMHAADIAEHSFTMARKGYTPSEVHEFLGLVAERVAQLEGEVDWERARVEHQQRKSAAASGERRYQNWKQAVDELIRDMGLGEPAELNGANSTSHPVEDQQ